MKIGIVEYINCAHKTKVERQYEMHGHTYKIEVSIEGIPEGDYLLGFENLKSMVKEVLSKYNYKTLNDFMKNPTAEVFSSLLYKDLKSKFKGYGLHLKVWQGNDCWVELH
ncbi:MAG: 6-carboxytetrahydropterin synthase [Candidatus Micrarchaeota archaeon]